jgi:hypothetical protein
MTNSRLVVRISIDGVTALLEHTWSLDSLAITSREGDANEFEHFFHFPRTSVAAASSELAVGANVDISFELDHFEICRIEAVVVSSAISNYETRLRARGPHVDSVALRIVRQLVASDETRISWAALRREKDRNSWLLACLWFQRQIVAKPRNRVSRIHLTTDAFVDRAAVFCLIGEQIFGYGGYAGQDLDGFEEVAKGLSVESNRIELILKDRALVRSKMRNYLDGADFLEQLTDILESTGGSVFEV